MTLFLLLLVVLATAWIVALARAVRQDGLGTRLPPRSHRDWWEDAVD